MRTGSRVRARAKSLTLNRSRADSDSDSPRSKSKSRLESEAATHSDATNLAWGQIRSQTLSHGLALHLGHAMALHFVVECDMTRYIEVCCVVAGHDIHDMAWRVVARDVEFYAAWTQPNRLRAWTQPKTYAWRLRSRTQSKSGFESNSETTAELGI